MINQDPQMLPTTLINLIEYWQLGYLIKMKKIKLKSKKIIYYIHLKML